MLLKKLIYNSVNMKELKNLNIEIFADGADYDSIINFSKDPLIKGFTTNPTLMKKAGVLDYKSFAKDILNVIDDKPISFEVFADDIDEMERQAYEIASWGKNINIKIPITNTKGHSTAELVRKLTDDKIICNVTAIFTNEQLKSIIDKISNTSKIILSVFAGRIADTGIDPIPLIKESVNLSKNIKGCKILWASPREFLNIFQAEDAGCHIITLAPDLISKVKNYNKNLDEFSLETVKMFFNDAQNAGYKI